MMGRCLFFLQLKLFFELNDHSTRPPSRVISKGICSCGQKYIDEDARNFELGVKENNDINNHKQLNTLKDTQITNAHSTL